MENMLKYVMYAIWFILLIFGFWFSITFTVMLLKEVNSVFFGLVIIATEIFCLCGACNVLVKMKK